MTANSKTIDMDYRPETYWPESRTPEQLLANIKGKARRDMARRILAEEGFAGLNEFVAREELEGEDLIMWGRVHPAMMGGEYLPGLQPGEVEIARISLASTTGDQISIRAKIDDGKIRYTVADEYESSFHLFLESSEAPLTLEELVNFIDESKYDGDSYSGGLAISHMDANLAGGCEAEELEGFVSVESSFYPGLASYYESVMDNWVNEHRAVDEEEYE